MKTVDDYIDTLMNAEPTSEHDARWTKGPALGITQQSYSSYEAAITKNKDAILKAITGQYGDGTRPATMAEYHDSSWKFVHGAHSLSQLDDNYYKNLHTEQHYETDFKVKQIAGLVVLESWSTKIKPKQILEAWVLIKKPNVLFSDDHYMLDLGKFVR